ncbi:MAG: tetratricopeptide repeat protein, partial [Solirubrobacteraceae bacterium]
IPSPLQPVSGSHGSPSRALPLIALALVALGIVLVVTQLGSGGAAKRTAAVRHSAPRGARHKPAPAAAKTTHSASSSASATATSTAAASTTTAASSTPSVPATDASALQLQGHQELLSGNYAAAISTLERAVRAAAPGSLPYAYALYDLGDALLRSGNAKAAVPVLQQRLQIPNQTSTVQALLNQALQAAGQAPAPGSPANTGGTSLPPGHGHGRGNGQGNAGNGGD